MREIHRVNRKSNKIENYKNLKDFGYKPFYIRNMEKSNKENIYHINLSFVRLKI